MEAASVLKIQGLQENKQPPSVTDSPIKDLESMVYYEHQVDQKARLKKMDNICVIIVTTAITKSAISNVTKWGSMKLSN